MKFAFVLILILTLLGVHILSKPIDMPYEEIGNTILGHSVRIDKEGGSTPYIVVQDTPMYSVRYTREGYLNAYKLNSSAIHCWR